MRYLLNIIPLLIFFCTYSTLAQREWIQQNSGTTSHLRAVDFVDENTGFAAGDVLLKTTNGGSSWIVLPLSGSFRDIDFLDENLGYIASAGVILKTTDGGITWTPKPGVQSTNIFSLSFLNDLNGIVVGNQCIALTTDGGDNWIAQPSFGQDWFGAFYNNTIAIAVGHNSTISRSTNFGLIWEFTEINQDDFQAVHFFNENVGVIVGDGAIWQSTDNGNQWIDRGFPEDIFGIYCASETDYMGAGLDGRILSTTDGLVNWGYENSGTTEHLWDVQMIGCGNWIVVGNGGTILKTKSLTPEEMLLNIIDEIDELVNVGVLNKGRGNSLISKLQNAIKSINRGNIKAAINKIEAFINQVNAYLNSEILTEEQSQSLITAAEDVIAELNLCESASKPLTSIKAITPEDLHLAQNFPNPFNPSTLITYHIPEAGFVTLKVYDVIGNEVANLVSENKGQGSYSVTFDATDLPSGIYVYQLKVNSFIETKKMILMK